MPDPMTDAERQEQIASRLNLEGWSPVPEGTAIPIGLLEGSPAEAAEWSATSYQQSSGALPDSEQPVSEMAMSIYCAGCGCRLIEPASLATGRCENCRSLIGRYRLVLRDLVRLIETDPDLFWDASGIHREALDRAKDLLKELGDG